MIVAYLYGPLSGQAVMSVYFEISKVESTWKRLEVRENRERSHVPCVCVWSGRPP